MGTRRRMWLLRGGSFKAACIIWGLASWLSDSISKRLVSFTDVIDGYWFAFGTTAVSLALAIVVYSLVYATAWRKVIGGPPEHKQCRAWQRFISFALGYSVWAICTCIAALMPLPLGRATMWVWLGSAAVTVATLLPAVALYRTVEQLFVS